MTTVHLERVGKTYGEVRALEDVTLTVAPGEFVVVVGPSGCGKSTLLRLVAGLETVSSGEIYFDGKPVSTLPPQRRDVGMVFQNYAIYPHMTVAENLAFPLRVRRVPAEECMRRVREVAALLGLEQLLDRYPRQLSGGQQQRVAVGRALVRSPRVFLFDEPLSNLDAQLRVGMRTELVALQRRLGITTLYVTHDHTEALTMGHRIAVLRSGRLQQVGTPEELYTNPQNLFVATFLGTPQINTIDGSIELSDGSVQFTAADGSVRVQLPLSVLRSGVLRSVDRVTLAIRPEHLRCSSDGELVARVEHVEFIGHERLVQLAVGSVPLVMRVAADAALEPGSQIGIAFDPARVLLFDAEGQRL